MKLVMLLGIVILTAACSSKSNPLGNDNFVPIEHQDGIYVLNTRTGEIFRIKDGERYRVLQYDSDLDGRLADIVDAQNPVQIDLTFGVDKVVKFEGMSKIVAEQPKVRGSITPYSDGLNALTDVWFRLIFTDSDHFQISEVNISRADLIRFALGEQFGGWTLQKDLQMSTEQYRNVASVDVVWMPGLDETVSGWLETEEGQKWKNLKLPVP